MLTREDIVAYLERNPDWRPSSTAEPEELDLYREVLAEMGLAPVGENVESSEDLEDEDEDDWDDDDWDTDEESDVEEEAL